MDGERWYAHRYDPHFGFNADNLGIIPPLRSSDEQASLSNGSSHPRVFLALVLLNLPLAALRVGRLQGAAYATHALKNLFKAIGIPPKAQAAGASRDSESTSMGSYRKSEPKSLCLYPADLQTYGRREVLMLLAVLAVSVTYQAGMNPPGGFWAGPESEHSRYHGSNKLKDVLRSQKLFSCMLAIALVCPLINLFKSTGVPPKDKAAGSPRDSESTSMINNRQTEPENTSGPDSMVAYNNAINVVDESEATWIVDSGAINHMTGNRSLLSDFKTSSTENVRHVILGDGSLLPVTGMGSVMTDKVELPDVSFVEGLKMNVVSVSQLVRHRCLVVFHGDVCDILDATGEIVGKATFGGSLLKLEFLKVPLVN